jgi:DNA-binding Lrp family transcriptional regulator
VLKLVEAFVLIRVIPVRLDDAPDLVQNVKKNLSKVKGVKEIKGVFGRYDFVAIVEVGTAEELGKLVAEPIRSIKGVAETETLIVGY